MDDTNKGVETGTIYLLTFPNRKQYIGQTWGYDKRMQWYRSGGDKGQRLLYRAIRKYGRDSFTSRVLANGIRTQEELDFLEDSYIKMFGTLSPAGYNLKEGGRGGRHSVETRDLISDIKSTQEERERQSKMMKEYYETPGARERASKAQKKAKGTQEERERQSKEMKKRYESPGARERKSKEMKEFYDTPGARERKSKEMKEFYDTPGARERASKAQKLRRARERAQKQAALFIECDLGDRRHGQAYV